MPVRIEPVIPIQGSGIPIVPALSTLAPPPAEIADEPATAAVADTSTRAVSAAPPTGTRLLRRMVGGTVGACFRYRVTGLAAEAAFFALVSLPPLLLGLVGTLGYLADAAGSDTVADIHRAITEGASVVLSDLSVQEVVTPTLDTVLASGRPDITVLGALIALWAGSRALNVYVDTITIMYGLGGERGIVRTRALSFGLYLVGLVIGAVLLPLVIAGPSLVGRVVPATADTTHLLYWPVVSLLSVAFLTSLYHLSVPVRTRWRRELPGAIVALVIWVLGSYLLRLYLEITVEGPSAYGSLAAPVALLFWLYVTALAVLIGAALNAQIDRVWPTAETARARASHTG
ncbi:MAG TPA: YihY/virulence factor BrkB family protein [Actinomycetes bacterium]|jgi:membrane protein|nr:YihY/virulence factor BrkB family protein [Actinomycetes bacterium]